jgi:Kdo2-lipid IVA lauroyltransferase/acyltransferase
LIRKQPEFYLWSHKRWKHKRPGHIRLQGKEII